MWTSRPRISHTQFKMTAFYSYTTTITTTTTKSRRILGYIWWSCNSHQFDATSEIVFVVSALFQYSAAYGERSTLLVYAGRRRRNSFSWSHLIALSLPKLFVRMAFVSSFFSYFPHFHLIFCLHPHIFWHRYPELSSIQTIKHCVDVDSPNGIYAPFFCLAFLIFHRHCRFSSSFSSSSSKSPVLTLPLRFDVRRSSLRTILSFADLNQSAYFCSFIPSHVRCLFSRRLMKWHKLTWAKNKSKQQAFNSIESRSLVAL